MKLSSWLRIDPSQTVAFRLDGEQQVVLSKAVKRYAVAEQAILDSGAEHIEAIDKEGRVLRSLVLPNQEEEQKVERAQSEQVALMQLYAKELAAAYKQGAADHAKAFEESQKAIVSLANAAIQRSAQLERLLTQILRDAQADAREALLDAEEAKAEAEDSSSSSSPLDLLQKMRDAKALADLKKAGGTSA